MASNHGGYSAAPVGRTRPSFQPDMSQGSMASVNTNGDATADLLREQQMERDRLQMDNFNLMMRITVLEERLANTQSGYTEDFEAELLQKRIENEEKDAKIRQQKEHMLRAVEAIEQLKRQVAEAHMALERARAQSNQVEEMETMRHVLAKTEEELGRCAQRARDAESALANANEEKMAIRAKYEEAADARQRLENELSQTRQKLQQMDVQQSKGALQVEHLQSVSKQRDEQLQGLASRLEQASQEKQQMESKYQAQMKRMEEQMRAQVDKLRQEGEKYRTEYMRATGERDKVQFERERFASDLDSVQQEKNRYQAEWERIAKEMDRLNGEAEAVRLQNVKLSATCEHQAQTLESYKSDRESAADNLHKLESEANEWRKRSSDRDVAVKTLEMRCKNAENEVSRLQERLESVTTRHQHTASERVAALEQGKNAMEAQNYELRMTMASLQQQLESLESKCQSYESRAGDESAKAKEYKARLLATETELRRVMAHAEQQERQLAQATNSSQSEGTRLQQYGEQITLVINERNQLMETLTAERNRFEAIQKSHATLEAQNQQYTHQYTALAREIQGIVGFGDELSYRSLDTLLREAKITLQRHFKAESDVLVRRWQEQAEAMRTHVDGLSSKLHTCHTKLEALQRAGLHARDDAKSIDRSWMAKYDNLRAEADTMRRSLEDSVRSEQYRSVHLEASLAEVRQDLEMMTQSRQGTLSDLERDILDLKESNRLLLGELQERRRSADHSRKQYLQAVAENKDLLSAVDILKNGIVDRDKQIEFYKATILRTTQQLQRGGSMGDVKQKLLEQLEQTQYMVNETYKKWSHSEIGGGGHSGSVIGDRNGFYGSSSGGANNNGHASGGGDATAWVTQLDESVGRLEVVCDRWREYIQQSRDLQRRYGDAWRSAALSFGKGKERPTWVDDVERKCARLLTESVRVSEAMRDVVEDVVNALQHARSSAEKKKKTQQQQHRSRSVDRANGVRRRSSSTRERERMELSPLREHHHHSPNDDALSLEHFNGDGSIGDRHTNNNNNANTNDVLFLNRGKRMSRASAHSRNGSASAIYGHSLASLGRIGDELKTIEKKIKTYPDE